MFINFDYMYQFSAKRHVTFMRERNRLSWNMYLNSIDLFVEKDLQSICPINECFTFYCCFSITVTVVFRIGTNIISLKSIFDGFFVYSRFILRQACNKLIYLDLIKSLIHLWLWPCCRGANFTSKIKLRHRSHYFEGQIYFWFIVYHLMNYWILRNIRFA